MKFFKFAFLFCFWPTLVHSQEANVFSNGKSNAQLDFDSSQKDPIGYALQKSGINSNDSTQVRISKLQWLLNHNNYLGSFDPDQSYGPTGYERLDVESKKLIADRCSISHGSNAIGKFKNGYEVDGLRAPEEMLRNRCGGACGTHALSFGKLLQASGISADRIRIVSAITDDDLVMLCPGQKKELRRFDYQNGASGHVFVMVKLDAHDDKSWTLINTTQDPLEKDFEGHYRGVHGDQIQNLSPALSHNNSQTVTSSLLNSLNASDIDQTNYSQFPWSAASLKQQISTTPVKIPENILNSTPKMVGRPGHEVNFRKMTIFSVDKVDDYPKNDLDQRYNFAASGSKDSPTCRYSCKEIDSSKCKDAEGPGFCPIKN